MKLTLKFITSATYIFTFLFIFATSAFCAALSSEKNLSYKFAQYFSNKNLEGMASLLSDDIVVYDPGKVTKGKENFLKLLKSNFDKTNTILFPIFHMYQQGKTTIFEFKLSFDNDTYEGVDVVEWKNNKMKEIRCYYYPSSEPKING
jgi:ketosteroid isomerase-like protein